MSLITIIWSLTAGVFLTLAAMHMQYWMRARHSLVRPAFSLWAASMAVLACFELAMLLSRSPAHYGGLLLWIRVPYTAALIAWLLFVREFLHAGRTWLLWLFAASAVLELIVTVSIGTGGYFREPGTLQRIELWGETVAIPAGFVSPYAWIGWLAALLGLVFTLDASFTAWRAKRRRQSIVIVTSVLMHIIGSLVFTIGLTENVLSAPITVSIPGIAIALVISYEFSNEMLGTQRSRERLMLSQHALKESEKNAQMLLAATNDMGQLLNEDGIILDVNDRMAEYLNSTRQELIGTRIFDRFPEKEAIHRKRWMEKVLKEGKPLRVEDYVSLKGRHFESIIYPVATDTAEKRKVVMIAHDITERKQAETALRESEQRFYTLFEHVEIGLALVDPDGHLFISNPELVRFLGYSSDELRRMTFRELTHPEDVEADAALFAELIAGTRDAYSFEKRYITRDGRTVWGLLTVSLVRNEDRTIRFAIKMVEDIDERRKVEQERVQLRQELSHLNRLMTMSELSSTLAHEINQPLGAILNNASVAKTMLENPRQSGDAGEFVEILDDIIRDTTRAGNIVRRIRGFVKKGAMKPEPVDMNTLVVEVVELFRNPLNREKIAVRKDLHPGLIPVGGNAVQLQQVLMNLIMNATDAMKGSARRILTIRTAMPRPNTVSVSVSDIGPGIDEQQKNRIFEPFYSTKKNGLGMGLRICRSIVEDLGGIILADNDADGGATFTFTLPAYRKDHDARS